MRKSVIATVLFVSAIAMSSAKAEIKVGFVTSLSGNGASIGIPYSKGMKAAQEYKSEIGGEKITVIELDDTSDPSNATRNARKLVEEYNVDVLIGTATAPSAAAMMAVAKELKVPMISIAPIVINEGDGSNQWGVTLPQTARLMISVIGERMKRDGNSRAGFIGFSDAWGDLCYDGAKSAEAEGKIKVLTNERYARTDTSVSGQVLKLLASKPDAVLLGSSGTQGALPPLELEKRGYKGQLYGTAALANADFIRVGGKAVDGLKIAIGPVVVAEQLPDDHFSKKISMAFRDAYQKGNGQLNVDNFAPLTFDAWLVILGAADIALKEAKPGTQEFRNALKEAIFKLKELKGTHAVYNFKKGESYGIDERSIVVVKLNNGSWTYEP